MLALTTQCVGFGIAGLMRRWLVEPGMFNLYPSSPSPSLKQYLFLIFHSTNECSTRYFILTRLKASMIWPPTLVGTVFMYTTQRRIPLRPMDGQYLDTGSSYVSSWDPSSGTGSLGLLPSFSAYLQL